MKIARGNGNIPTKGNVRTLRDGVRPTSMRRPPGPGALDRKEALPTKAGNQRAAVDRGIQARAKTKAGNLLTTKDNLGKKSTGEVAKPHHPAKDLFEVAQKLTERLRLELGKHDDHHTIGNQRSRNDGVRKTLAGDDFDIGVRMASGNTRTRADGIKKA